jgi:prepilin-type N-terminal cleavage/methylation domain-containing protein
MNTKKGFTLIELLVVIAIIGMMSSIVLASLNSARAKASDATIKADLANLRSQAALYYDTNGTYGTAANCIVTSGTMITNPLGSGSCSGNILADATFIRGVYGAAAASGSSVTAYANVSPTDWAVLVPLKTAPTNWQCVDSSGSSKVVVALPSTLVTVCP